MVASKLGLLAVGALALSGLVVTTPAQAADGAGVVLISQLDGPASLRDGATVDVVAERLDPDAVVTIEYNPDPAADDADPGWTEVASQDSALRQYTTASWDGTADGVGLAGTSVALRAVANVEGEEPTYSTRRDVAVSDGPPVHRVSVGSGGDVQGYFVQPYVDAGRTRTLLSVTGETSATDGTVELSAWRSSAGAYQAQAVAPVSPTDGTFTGALDVTGYDVGLGQLLALRAERDSDDVQVVVLAEQTVGTIYEEGQTTRSAGTAVDLVVLDDTSLPVVGAEVRRAPSGTLVGYTDATGLVTATQANESSATYYVNTTDADAYDAGLDPATSVETPEFVPVATATQVVLADGDVFDDQEYDDGDLALQVVDQDGRPLAALDDLTYELYATAAGPESADPVLASTDEAGRLVVPFDPTGPDGEYTLTSTSPGSAGGDDQPPVTFVAGDATLGLTPGSGAAASGGRITYAGSLTVAGRPLPGRAVDLGYDRGTELAPGRDADAGILGGVATLTTGADGTFAVTVADPAEAGGPTETGGTLTATVPGLGDTATAGAEFGSGKVVGTLRLTGASKGGRADRLTMAGPAWLAGEHVELYARAKGRWTRLSTTTLPGRGTAKVKVKDRNGRKATRYYVRLLTSERVTGSKSGVTKLP